jgi:RNA polymerase sigma factor (sigma-70 family)
MGLSRKQVARILKTRSKMIGIFARKYAGRGAEREDLVQEGYLSALRMIKERSKKHLKKALDNCLMGMVRDAAQRMRYREGTVQLSQCDGEDEGEPSLKVENLPDERAQDEVREIEIRCDLERELPPEEANIASLLMKGYTHAEIARDMGISQQAATMKVKRMRAVLKCLRDNE